MTERKERKIEGSPVDSFNLARDLIKALQKSECIRKGKDNRLVMFDVMMGMAEFTEIMLRAMEKACRGTRDFHEFYNIALDKFHSCSDELFSVLDDTDGEKMFS